MIIHNLLLCYAYVCIISCTYSIDATRESNKVGRLINHSREHPNLSPKVIAIGGKPNIIFTANQIINKEEELLYDYGETRKLILEEHHWLNN